MTPETTDSGSRNGTGTGPGGDAQPDPRPTRRGVLLGVGLAGLGGALAGCSTSAVPYGANEAGAVPGAQGPGPMATSGTMPGPGTMSSPDGGAQASPSASDSAQSGAKLTGTVLGAASEVPVGGGKIYTAAKVVVTQPAAGRYKAFSAVCTHVGCIMSEVARGTIDCPCHGGQFKITNGAVVAGPPPSPLPARPVKVVNGQVVLL
jgi:Rieske Fe-S protein